MLKRLFRFIIQRSAAAVFIVLASLGTAQADTITVFAAASLKAALDDIAVQFEQSFDHKLHLSFAGSSALARQIERGAPADVFISANINWMDLLEAQGLLVPDTRVALLTNELVLITPADSGITPWPIDEIDIVTLLEGSPLAMAFVDAVPAGIYGKAAFVFFGVWDELSQHVAQTDNVRGALALVARGEARLGVVYATDARAEPRVSVVATFPKTSHAPIVYPAAVVAPATKAAQEFANYLMSPEARLIFNHHGFGSANP
jgi:molybdate transport system substrate-binding protein